MSELADASGKSGPHAALPAPSSPCLQSSPASGPHKKHLPLTSFGGHPTQKKKIHVPGSLEMQQRIEAARAQADALDGAPRLDPDHAAPALSPASYGEDAEHVKLTLEDVDVSDDERQRS